MIHGTALRVEGEDSRARIEQYGVCRYITKPADLDEFIAIGRLVKELLWQKGAAAVDRLLPRRNWLAALRAAELHELVIEPDN